jgi:hypothetical protein
MFKNNIQPSNRIIRLRVNLLKNDIANNSINSSKGESKQALSRLIASTNELRNNNSIADSRKTTNAIEMAAKFVSSML